MTDIKQLKDEQLNKVSGAGADFVDILKNTIDRIFEEYLERYGISEENIRYCLTDATILIDRYSSNNFLTEAEKIEVNNYLNEKFQEYMGFLI